MSHPGDSDRCSAGAYLTVMGLFGLGLGAIVRNTAGGIAALAGIVLVLPPLMDLLRRVSAIRLVRTCRATRAVPCGITTEAHTLAPWAGFAVFCAYAVVALAVAGGLTRPRDT